MADREKLIDLRREGEEIAENFCVSKQECYQCPYNAPNGCKEGLIADHLIANGVVISNSETTTKWIPVTERLPEESGLFLVYTARGMVMEMDYSAKYKQFNMYDDGIGTPIACTHWMHLPEPPKGE